MQANRQSEEPIHISILKLEIKKVFLESILKYVGTEQQAEISASKLIDIAGRSRKDTVDYIKKMWISAADKSDLHAAVNEMVDNTIDTAQLDLQGRKSEILSKIDNALHMCDIEHKILKMKKEGMMSAVTPHYTRMKVPESKL